MAMDSRIRIAPSIWGIISIPPLLLLVWCSGFLYWRITIPGAISDLRRDSATKLTAAEPPSKLLHEAGSRAIPFLLEAMNDSVRRQDRDLANLLYLVYCDNVMCAYGEGHSISTWVNTLILIPKSSSLEYLRLVAEDEETRWEKRKKRYPPWWMWWSGKHRRK
jgi:hypothetical protein